MTDMSRYEIRTLHCLHEESGWATPMIAKMVLGYESPAQVRNAVALSMLRRLRSRGLVTLMDDQRPLVWIRTAAGTQALLRVKGDQP